MSPSVLIVDDEPAIRENLSRWLGKRGYEVICTGTGQEALAVHEHRRVDVVLLDLGLPDISGIEVLERLKASPGAPAVIVLTARDDEATALPRGVARPEAFVQKPVDLRDLEALVGSLVNADRAQP